MTYMNIVYFVTTDIFMFIGNKKTACIAKFKKKHHKLLLKLSSGSWTLVTITLNSTMIQQTVLGELLLIF